MMKKMIFGLLVLMMVSLTGAFYACEGFHIDMDSYPVECAHIDVTETVTLEPTCTEEGTITVVCNDCGEMLDPIAIEPHGHSFGDAEVTPATCTEAEKYVAKCIFCEEEEVTYEGEPLGHNYEAINTYPATCVQPEMADHKCSRCEDEYYGELEGGQPAAGHEYEEENRVDATCTETGEVTYVCIHGDDEYTDIIPALGHTSDGVKADVVTPTCVTKGYTTYHCSVCNEDYIDDYVAATGHELGDAVTYEASCSSMGYDARACEYNCGYVERTNIVKSLAHDFDDEGKCPECGKFASEAFLLECGAATPFAIDQEGVTYTVYSKSYKEEVVFLSYESLQALYNEGIYSFGINLGANEGKYARSLSMKINGGQIAYVNTSSAELKFMSECVFADANGILDEFAEGVSFAIYYRAMDYAEEIDGGELVNSYAIRFDYNRQFDINNYRSWLKTGMSFTYDESLKTFTVMDIMTGATNNLAIRKELLQYYYEQGYTSIKVVTTGIPTQKLSMDGRWYSNGNLVTNTTANLTLEHRPIELTEELCQYDLDYEIYINDLYEITAWGATERADRFVMTVEFLKEINLQTSLSAQNVVDSTVTYEEGTGWTLTKTGAANGYVSVINPEFIAKQKAAGYKILRVIFDNTVDGGSMPWVQIQVVSNASGQDAWVDLYGNIAGKVLPVGYDGNCYFDIDLTNENYVWNNAAYGVRIILTQATAVVKSMEYLTEIPAGYFVRNAANATVAYDANNKYYTFTKATGANSMETMVMPDAITQMINAGYTTLRITFDATYGLGNWLEVIAWTKPAGTVTQNLLYRNNASVDSNGRKYVDVDLTQGYLMDIGYGVKIVLTQDIANVILTFFTPDERASYFVASDAEKSEVSYNVQTGWTLTNKQAVGNGFETRLSPSVVKAQVEQGKKLLRVTFDGSVSTSSTPWAEVLVVSNASGGDAWVRLYGHLIASYHKNYDDCYYFDIDLTNENYVWSNAAYGVKLVLTQASATIKSVEFLDEIPKTAYFRANVKGNTTVAYDEINDYWVVTKVNDENVFIMPDVITEQLNKGLDRLRITFVGTPVSTSWLELNVWNASGKVVLARQWSVKTDADGNEYVEIGINNNYLWTAGYGVQLVFSHGTTNVALKFDSYAVDYVKNALNATIAYNAENSSYTLTKAAGQNSMEVMIQPDFISNMVTAGYKKVRITFDATYGLGAWLQTLVWTEDAAGNVAQNQLHREFSAQEDANGCKFVEIDITQNYIWRTGYGIKIVLTQDVANITLTFTA